MISQSGLDLLIMGAGLTGLSAAYTAAQAGLRVRVIAKGMGVTHWHAGTIDVLGYLPGAPNAVEEPLAALLCLPEDHPYRLMGAERLRSALESFAALTTAVGLPYAGAEQPGHNLLLPSPVGAARPVFLAPAAQRAGDLRRDEPFLVVGFTGLRDFYPKLIVENLDKLGHAARSLFLPLSLLTPRRDINPVQLAKRLDEPAIHRRLARALGERVRPGERIGLPAILGFHSHRQVIDALEEATGAPVFEIPTLPPSAPGIRLYDALRRHLQGMGVRVEVGMEVIGFRAQGDRILWVETETSSRPLRHRARRFLLATGGLLGGGITGDHTGRVEETVFGLPLTVPQDRGQWFRPLFLDPEGQPIFRGGVPVNAAFQPVNGDGAPVYANLWAAGGLLAHADPIHERSLEGIGIATGMAAVDEMITNIEWGNDAR